METTEGLRRLDLYDFFSILIPGTFFIFGLYPFLPASVEISNLGALVPLLIAGFVAGRALHSAAISIEDVLQKDSHRDAFESELANPKILSKDVVDEFYEECKRAFHEFDPPDSRIDAVAAEAYSETPDEIKLTTIAGWRQLFRNIVDFLFPFAAKADSDSTVIGTLYVVVRSYVHMDGRGRSRTFQAVHAFYRSSEVGSVILLLIWFGYSAKRLLAENIPVILPYKTKVDLLGIGPEVIAIGSIAGIIVIWKTFSVAKSDYRRYFIQYLIVDFLILRGIASEENRSDSLAESVDNLIRRIT